ncbi:hypothetical protein CALVIDRAFT_540064 [Calocera viscosa TUFC12733]|uniref:Mug135-like C-terminal domain-containing protein n=1 Tax=Calocera viscosa (strain TUFC12733) TaxID=1330018 RepID=A0A167J8D6_CALVF|nr:hypothetical protein CALVIDRAFT_540064 [Calocera viscosa TUFC12733]
MPLHPPQAPAGIVPCPIIPNNPDRTHLHEAEEYHDRIQNAILENRADKPTEEDLYNAKIFVRAVELLLVQNTYPQALRVRPEGALLQGIHAPFEDEQEEMNESIEQLEEEQGGHEQQLQRVQVNIVALQRDSTAMRGQIHRLEDDIRTTKVEIGSLKVDNAKLLNIQRRDGTTWPFEEVLVAANFTPPPAHLPRLTTTRAIMDLPGGHLTEYFQLYFPNKPRPRSLKTRRQHIGVALGLSAEQITRLGLPD